MKNAFSKGVLRSITHSLGRFLAIAVIAALGTGFYAGLRMTGPDMRLAADQYFDATHMADLRVVSTLGLSDESLDMLRDVEGVEDAMPAREVDVLATVEDVQYTMRVQSFDTAAARASDTSDGVHVYSDDASYLNRPILVSGSWPEGPNECVLMADVVMDGSVAAGDTVTVLEGTGRFSIDGTPHICRAGQTIVMPEGKPHAVYAEEAFKMLLSIVFSDNT